MNPSLVLDSTILKLLEEERAYIESRYNLPKNSSVSSLSLFNELDDTVDIPNALQTNKIIQIRPPLSLKSIISYAGCNSCTNSIIYTPKSVLDWHTNSNRHGERVYISYSYGESIFRYRDRSGNIIDSYDIPNSWQVRRFTVPHDYKLWHTVACSGSRITYGFINGSHG